MKTFKENLVPAINIVAFLLFLYFFIRLRMPMIGHDFRYFLPRLLDSYLHYKINGLSIQWYTPSFGGGLPSYPNPQQIQFSLPQFLTLFFDPWRASIFSIGIFALAGYSCFYVFLKDILKLNWTAATLGAFFVVANGFFIEHVTVGHFGYFPFPIISIVILLAFHKRVPAPVAGIGIAWVAAILIHQAGFYLLVIFLFSALMCLPILYLASPNLFDWRRLMAIAGVALPMSLLINGSKLYAIFSFMRFFPRVMHDSYQATAFPGWVGALQQLLGVMNLSPLLFFLGRDESMTTAVLRAVTGSDYGLWELDASLSPALFVIFFGGFLSLIPTLMKKRSRLSLTREKIIAWAFLCLGIWVTVEFSRANGILYTYLKDLPALASLHVNVRFVSAFIFPASLTASWMFDKFHSGVGNRKIFVVSFAFLNILALVSPGAYLLFKSDPQYRTFNISRTMATWKAMQNGKKFPVLKIASLQEDASTFTLNASNLKPYEPIFGYELESFRPRLKEGSIVDVNDGYFNMTNPASLVFPEINHTVPFERIPAEQRAQLDDFSSRRQADWQIPPAQKILDWASLIALTASPIAVFLSFKSARRRLQP